MKIKYWFLYVLTLWHPALEQATSYIVPINSRKVETCINTEMQASDSIKNDLKNIKNDFNVKDFGAVGDYNIKTKTGTDNKASFQKALDSGDILVPPGLYYFDINSASGSITIPSNRSITFEKGATIVFGRKNIYYAAFVIVGKENIVFNNPSFLWTGKLTYGEGFDNINDREESENSNRYGTAHAYSNRHYCAAIWAAESNNITINNFSGESITRDGNSVIYNWIHAVRVNYLVINKATMNDMLLGVMSQGGYGGKISNITADRMSQDIGIPGHVVYSFRTNCPVENVNDSGTETGLTNKRISHTVSQKNKSDVKGIISRRAEGAYNYSCNEGANFTDITWKENLRYPQVGTNPKVYLITSTANKNMIGRNVFVEAYTEGCSELFGGIANESTFQNFTLIRKDSIAPNFGFLKLKGSGNTFNGNLIQKGSVDANIVKNFNGNANKNLFELRLTGFKNSPIVNVGSNANYNHFVIIDEQTNRSHSKIESRHVIFLGKAANNTTNYSTSKEGLQKPIPPK